MELFLAPRQMPQTQLLQQQTSFEPSSNRMFETSEMNSSKIRPEEVSDETTTHWWVCDVCMTCKFDNYDEACRHEDRCRKGNEESTIIPEASTTKYSSLWKSPRKIFKIRPKDDAINSFLTADRIVREDQRLSLTIDTGTTDGKRTKRKRPSEKILISSTALSVESTLDDNHNKHMSKNNFFTLRRFTENSNANDGVQESKEAVNRILPPDLGSENMLFPEQTSTERTDKRSMKTQDQLNHTWTVPPARETKQKRLRISTVDRFPSPSHTGALVSRERTPGKYLQELSALRLSPKHWAPGDKRSDIIVPFHYRPVPADAEAVNIKLRLLSSAIVPPAEIDLDDHDLWSRKYTIRNIPYDVCGASNQNVAISCIRFLEDWKMERLKAHSRRADKQHLLALGQKRRRFKSVCDSQWDEVTERDQALLPSVCLLTGPVGCGKTSLVHAVAKSCDCSVVEINTTEKRSYQNLRNSIEEATQSDSTIVMLKNKTSPQSIFFKNREAFIESDDEESIAEGSSLPVILIDEVDLLFEDNGDHGFWGAIKALSKKAKCPIFLTANSIPVAMNALSMDFKHFSMDRPTPEECSNKIWQVVKSEGIGRRQHWPADKVKYVLTSFAKLCDCDIRRILLEMQLFSKSKYFVPISDDSRQIPNGRTISTNIDNFHAPPMICKITPNSVSSDEPTILTIEGMGFASFLPHCIVSIGKHACETKVINDTIITLVCPPCNLQRNAEYSLRFPAIKIETARGIPRLVVGNRIHNVVVLNRVNIQNLALVNFEVKLSPKFHNESVEEAQGVESKNVSSNHSDNHRHLTSSRDAETSASIETPSSMNMSQWNDKDACASVELSLLARELEYQSDVSWIEDSMYGTPCLGGATHGFASHFVEELNPLSRETDPSKPSNDTLSKPPSFERILLSGWNDAEYFFGESESYFTQPTCRDRKLFAHVARFDRPYTMNSSAKSSCIESVEKHELDEEHTNHVSPTSDVVTFLQQSSPLHMLPSTIRRLTPKTQVDCFLNGKLISKQRECMSRTLQHVFGMLWNDVNASLVYARLLGQHVDGGRPCDLSLFLDYGPILSQMSLTELAASSVAEATMGQSSSKRVTRRAKKFGHDPYFLGLNGSLLEDDCRGIVKKMAGFILRY